MIKSIRNSKVSKIVAIYLTMMIFLEVTQPMLMYAITSGPTQPEFNAFTPISTSDMVDLTSGNFNYNIPIMDVGGYPLNLAYNSGITMDQEASWVGLGWNLNVGQIERQVRGMPDDFRGDEIRYENDLKTNITVGTNFNYHPAVFGHDLNGTAIPGSASHPISMGIGVQYNNYEGLTFIPSFGASFALSDNVSVGANFSSSVGEGATVSPSVSISSKVSKEDCSSTRLGFNFGVDFNSRKGVENLNISATSKRTETNSVSYTSNGETATANIEVGKGGGAAGGRLSLNTQSYTPTKRVAYDNMNFSFSAAMGIEVVGAEAQGQITGYGSYQKINSAYKNRKVKAYGYENTEYKGKKEGILDFNREKEATSVSKNTTALPVTNYTYDTYSVEGQGISGMFRPFRSQVTNVYNDDVTDNGVGFSAGLEFGSGNAAHVGGSFLVSPSTSTTGKWVSSNSALPLFEESNTDRNHIKYEPTSFKMVGEMGVDKENSLFRDRLGSNNAIRLKLKKKRYNNKTMPVFEVKNGTPSAPYTSLAINSKIKRSERYLRSQEVQKISDKEAQDDPFIIRSSKAKPHHTAGIKVLKEDGSTYVYGQPVYNTKKVESTFDVSGKSGGADYRNGILPDITKTSGNSSSMSDQYLNKITTPAYAHSYLLSSVLSTDYEDIDGNGPSEKDLGSYTKFEYEKKYDNFKWRVPFNHNTVSFNEGLKSNLDDEKGSYLYGEKELMYVKRIVTKTHVAIFSLSPRKDGIGATAELGSEGLANGRASNNNRVTSYKIDKIDLYSFVDAKAAMLLDDEPENDAPCIPIKTAHFEYDYSLCPKIDNNSKESEMRNGVNLNVAEGKLTLKKVYFTYRNSNMGKYTPYVFDYDESNTLYNPDYNMKGFDIWGNYKVNPTGITNSINSPLSTAEFPFTEQDTTSANRNTAAWTLKSVKLPSGGKLTIRTESDDYKYVQDKKAMQMFKVTGAGNEMNPDESDLTNNNLYEGNNHFKYIYVDLGIPDANHPVTNSSQFRDLYLSENETKPIYFRFLLNMVGGTTTKYDYVSGYFEIQNPNAIKVVEATNHHVFAAIPLKSLERGGGTGGSSPVNPIAKAGWGFGRTYLNRVVYSIGGNSSNTNFTSIVLDLVGSIKTISQLWKGPNKALQDKGCAKKFIAEKSWIRLENPIGRKYGGGLRVKSVELSDNWDVMVSTDNSIYKQKYGQDYQYKLDDGSSSGVATFEPNASAENALVEPFYPKNGNYGDRIASPKDMNYVEKPFGENFYPSPTVTYSKVSVSNLKREDVSTNKAVRKHATGKVVTEHYTSFDFPTISSYTDLNMANDKSNPVLSFLNILTIDHLTASQGFSIETNDMNGKIKSQKVYGEGQTTPISGVDYKYNLDQKGKLNNELVTINSDGMIEKNLLGVQYDVINDFNESNSKSYTMGFDGNLAAFIVGIFPAFVPTILPKAAYHENVLKTAVTTKVIYRSGILKEKIAYDLGSRVSTENLAWDSGSGQVILTKTNNEFDDAYYSLTYPAYWGYDGMGQASNNLGVKGVVFRENDCAFDPKPYFEIKNPLDPTNSLERLQTVFHLGDELYLHNLSNYNDKLRVWVVGFSSDNKGLLLMDSYGEYIDNCGDNTKSYSFTIVRSGYRNLQNASMASITLMKNPIDSDNDGNLEAYIYHIDYNADAGINGSRVINASAVEYNDFWKPQNEWKPGRVAGIYPTPVGQDPETSGEILHPFKIGYNPYVWNVKGDWRANKSYAFLTGRESSALSTRNKGYYKQFSTFYKRAGGGIWHIDPQGWTSASTINKYSPYGLELENEDALHRFSSAQYGYNNTLPMAVASNARYNEIGFEGFEEEDALYVTNKHFEFSYPSATPDGAEPIRDLTLSDRYSHTGKKSVRLAHDTSVKLVRKLSPKVIAPEERACTQRLECESLVRFELLSINNPIKQVNECSFYNYPQVRVYKIISKCSLPIVPDEYVPYGYAFSAPVPADPYSIILTITGSTSLFADEYLPHIYNNEAVVNPQAVVVHVGNFTTVFYDTPTLLVKDINSDYSVVNWSNLFNQCRSISTNPDGTPPEPCCLFVPGNLTCDNPYTQNP